ncbi:hypothetical protein BH10PSE17_BH10PSE17_24640 [soil metagenome]
MTPINPLDVGRVPLGHEPKGGDFARYVEQLGNAPRTQGPPMQSGGAAARTVATRDASIVSVAQAREEVRKLNAARASSNNVRAGAGKTANTTPAGTFLKIGNVVMGIGGALLVLSFMIGTGALTIFGFIAMFLGNAIRSFAKKAGA